MIRAAQRAYPNILWKAVLTFFLLYLLVLTKIILFKGIPVGALFEPHLGNVRFVNLVPFYTIFEFVSEENIGLFSIIAEMGENMAVFVPMGLFLPVLFQRCRGRDAVYLVLLFSSFFEAIQGFFHLGIVNVDDIFLNVAGGVLGVLLYKQLAKHFPEENTFLMSVISVMLFITGLGIFAYLLY